jgi:hypothetical protein
LKVNDGAARWEGFAGIATIEAGVDTAIVFEVREGEVRERETSNL